MSRILALLYGVVCYTIFFVTFLYAIGFVSDSFVPKTINTGEGGPLGATIAVNLLLMSVFALQHSIMARRQFKDWWTRIVPKPVERSTYVLFASLALLLLFWQWRPINEIIWKVEQPQLALALTCLSLVGWLLVLTSTFLINHFELFGLQQVAHDLAGKPPSEPRFRTPLLYRFVRHPIYLGFIIAFWVTPTMTAGHLLFAAVTTAYIVIGIMLEERDLVDQFGDEYRRYRDKVPMLVPGRPLSGGAPPIPRSHRPQSEATGEH